MGYWDTDWTEVLIGKQVVEVNDNEMLLSDGTTLVFEKDANDCCSYIELKRLAVTESIITEVKVEDNEDETGGEGPYKAWVHVITEAGELNIAEANGDASNGYYLHGFALDVSIKHPQGSVDHG